MMMQTAYAPMSARAAVKRNDTFMVGVEFKRHQFSIFLADFILSRSNLFFIFLQASDTSIKEVDVRKIKPTKSSELQFGRLFTDHMLEIDWTKDGGWEAPKIVPYGPINMATSATSLHYGISVHEGISVVENA